MPTSESLRIRKITVGATAAFGAVLAVLLAAYVWLDYQRTIDSASAQLQGESYALLEQADSLLRFGSGALASTRQQIQASGGIDRMSEKELHELFVRQIDVFSRNIADVPMHALFAVDANGRVAAASTGFPVNRVDASDREYFRHFSGDDDRGIHISQISYSRLTGLAVIFVTVALHDEKNRFAGVLGLSLRLKHFEDYYRNRGFRSGQTILLVRNDGKPLFRHPMTDDFPTSDVSTRSDFREMLERRSGVIDTESPYDKRHRLIAFRKAERFPLLAIVSEPKAGILTSWQRNALVAASILLASFVALALMLRFALRQIMVASEAAAASAAKSRFLAMISHEIRTPLNGILGMAQLLQMPEFDEQERREFAGTILNSGRSLLTLLNDVLDLSKIESGRLDFSLAPTEPAAIVAETAGLFQELARGKNLVLTADTLCPTTRRYLLDPVRVRQMLSNLVSNGIKFTDHGRVSIECREMSVDGNCALLEFAVSDTGIGIAPDMQSRLFQPFSQIASGLDRPHDGTGLGLSIVRSLAEALDGKTGVESQPGKGSRFWFHIRADVIPEQETSAAAAAVPSGADTQKSEQRTVLIADDNAENRQVLEAFLKRIGLAWISVQNGQQAFDLVADEAAIALILMDIDMPEMDGCMATELIRGLETTAGRRRMPIIGVSAHAFPEDRQRALDAGMDDFVAKPLDFAQLQELIGRWLQ